MLREAASPALWEADAAEGAAGEALPEGFEEEALSLARRTEARVDGRAGIVGFSTEEDAAASFAAIAEELAAKGWEGVESGVPSCGTFVKGEGRHRWLFVSCVQVGGGASVVVQCGAPADERS
ncbi:hypothetical protein [Arabiibacter massiliensis]|uniref:hypothetical protein n=1 Tax=Arabiibacter massiliensis TaxID=1870985 RepID=UPI001E549D57|nr:hypothetical protein [Arabiibacter massiliensis]